MKLRIAISGCLALLLALGVANVALAEGRKMSCVPTGAGRDALAWLLKREEAACPRDAFAFRAALLARRAHLATTLVANRGFHNPSQGSFSMFEIVTGELKDAGLTLEPGDFFFGHFTALAPGRKLVADQDPRKGSLMIEAFAWDDSKGLFNFYELRGDGEKGRWFYRGDSADILADTALLHRQPDPVRPRFGSALRCSGCHANGGPIMKEMPAPHNDWWTIGRKLDLGGAIPDAQLAPIFAKLVDANRLAASVTRGLLKLEKSQGFRHAKRSRSLQERLRPLFCPVEVNFESDRAPNEARAEFVRIPSAFFVDPRLARGELKLPRAAYERLLSEMRSRFPETESLDADHAWLAPVKARSDIIAVEALLREGLIDHDFAAAVLAVDLANPVFSSKRCGLLRLVPERDDAQWKDRFKVALRVSAIPAARELLANFATGLKAHKESAGRLLSACAAKLNQSATATSLYRVLLQRRHEIAASEISKNPRGQILEPGFRVIFPEGPAAPPPGAFEVSEDCEVTRVR